ncbi:unnamed protein product [Ostreobium quekettii]|uniref:Uncharacterized protein n=1 Tax=Ostreobium quekettii TaxID=121088 RepID=A0A8S1IYN0_9CHLO|nr:unnamed protein product [Ostreobium quekettii]
MAVGDEPVTYLNINKTITAVQAGRLDPELQRDVLIVGTPTSLQSYDVEENRDLFFRDVADGVNVAILGRMGTIESPLGIVGGNCSIQVGSDDFDIRVFQDEDLVAEVPEADVVVGLCPIQKARYGYALANGTIGVYNGTERMWRVKSRHSVCAIASFDLDGDGVPELLSGWSSGRFEVRKEDTGEVVFRDNMSSPISQILNADYRNDGVEDLIVCCGDGEVRGYLPADVNSTSTGQGIAAHKQILEKLNQKKQGVIVFGENLFANESLLVLPKQPSQESRVHIHPPKDVGCDALLKVLVGSRTGNIFQVFEYEQEIPKFAMYRRVEDGSHQDPSSSVHFDVAAAPTRLSGWLDSRFLHSPSGGDPMGAAFISLRDGASLVVQFKPSPSGCQVAVKTDNMVLAGDVVQDLAQYLSINELDSVADFPKEMEEFKDVLSKVLLSGNVNALRLLSRAMPVRSKKWAPVTHSPAGPRDFGHEGRTVLSQCLFPYSHLFGVVRV